MATYPIGLSSTIDPAGFGSSFTAFPAALWRLFWLRLLVI
jgi:hypothetical protein